jgi:phage gpG-like protein
LANYSVRDQGLYMRGFTNLTKALARIDGEGISDFGIAYELRRRLTEIGESVARAAPGYVSHRTGRHGDPSQPTLEESVRVRVTQNLASVYSTAVYGGVQNVGGRVGRNHATLLTRAAASGWMNKAVAETAGYVAGELDGLLDWLLAEFERD